MVAPISPVAHKMSYKIKIWGVYFSKDMNMIVEIGRQIERETEENQWLKFEDITLIHDITNKVKTK